MIELKSVSDGTYYVVDETDIVGLNTYKYNDVSYYSVIVKWSGRWISIDAETFFKIKVMLEARSRHFA
jgi:hypothetical protein